MGFRNILHFSALVIFVLVGGMAFAGKSLRDVFSELWLYLGPGFSLAFIALLIWGLSSLGRIRRGDPVGGAMHLGLVVTMAREIGLMGTVLGILTVTGSLGGADMTDKAGVLELIPTVLGGITLGLGTTLVFRLLAVVLATTGELSLSRHVPDSQSEKQETCDIDLENPPRTTLSTVDYRITNPETGEYR